jgi:hypothetical protein
MKYSSTFRVGRYTCTMTYEPGAKMVDCEWDPNTPPYRGLSRQEFDQYRAGRGAFTAKIAAGMGGKIAIIEA